MALTKYPQVKPIRKKHGPKLKKIPNKYASGMPTVHMLITPNVIGFFEFPKPRKLLQ